MVPGEKYHLFYHANRRENIFTEQKNYTFFLGRLAYHLLPVCKLFNYCMMPNHFHLALQVRCKDELRTLWQKPFQLTDLSQKHLELKTSKAFSNLFSSYTQGYNKVYNRMVSMFIPSIKMEKIGDGGDFCKVVHYTHSNPVHYGFIKQILDSPHSYYRIFLSKGPTRLERDFVLAAFGGLNAFIKYHKQQIDFKIKRLE